MSEYILKRASSLPQIALATLFPTFFFYHLLAAAGAIPLLFGPGWSVANILFGLVLAPLALLVAWDKKDLRVQAPLALLLIIAAAYGAFHFVRGEEWQAGREPLEETLKLLVGWVCLYAVGYLFRPSSLFVRVMLWCWVAMSLLTVGLMDPGSLSFIASDRFNAPEVATYQWFGQAYAFTTLLLVSLLAKQSHRALVAGMSLPVLFLLSSRADLGGMLVVGLVWVAVHLLRRPIQWRPIAMAGGATAAASLGVLAVSFLMIQMDAAGVSPTTATSNRQLELLNPESNESLHERDDLLQRGWADIQSAPLWGVYAGQARDGGRFGHYIHSALSAWHNYGLFAFVLYVGLSVWAAGRSGWEVFVRKSDDPMWNLALHVSVFCLVLILFAKSVYWPLPALAWGLVAAQSVRQSVPAPAYRAHMPKTSAAG